jgi:hypothetical protein
VRVGVRATGLGQPDAVLEILTKWFSSGDEIFEVKTGFLGLGKHYYIPMSAVQEVLTDSIFISKSREAFAELGYEEKPAHFVETP